MAGMKIETTPIDKLVPYVNNARTHSPEQVDQIAASIKEFGFNNPVLIDKKNGIIAGHGRVMAARKLELKEVPTVRLEHLTETQKKAFILADNKIAMNAGWDEELLALELKDLDDVMFDLNLTGFDGKELDELIQPEPVAGLTDEDEVPEEPIEPVTKAGDLWILGNHRLLCGDSTKPEDVERLMDGQKADMVFTDPPYNINYGNIKHPKSKIRSIENDNMTKDQFRDFCFKFIDLIKLHCDGCVYVFGPPGPDGRIMFTELDKVLHCSTTIIWNKDQFTLGRGKYQNKYEPCWFGWNKSGSAFTNDRKLTNVWDFPRPKSSDLHPTMKPVELVENAIGHSSLAGAVVLDSFGGSGSTLIASEKTGRKGRLIELDPKYCDVIIERWQNFTGKEALNEAGQKYNDLKNESKTAQIA